ncbi:MAG: hypothetical protein OXC60_14450 [Litoreibacter sp.]|nr:hypothetical protein [Litoreibacter sp.]MCY4335855.1 hypothetical protein [Litoreibacter sp.]
MKAVANALRRPVRILRANQKSWISAALAFALLAPASVFAQENDTGLRVELNAIDTLGENCRLTFVLQNKMADDIDQLVAETVLFSDEGGVVLLTLFDFAAVPAGRSRVRQFQVPNTSCDRLGQVLMNGIDTCTISGAASQACAQNLEVSSRVRIALGG